MYSNAENVSIKHKKGFQRCSCVLYICAFAVINHIIWHIFFNVFFLYFFFCVTLTYITEDDNKGKMSGINQLTSCLPVEFFCRSYNTCSCQSPGIDRKGWKTASSPPTAPAVCVRVHASVCFPARTTVYIESVNWVVIAIVCLIRGWTRPPSTLLVSTWECTCDTSSWQILRFLLTW